MEKVVVELEAGEWHDQSIESVWATKIGRDLFRIENSPFFANGLAFEDVVKTKVTHGENRFVEKVTSSGRSTYRIIPGKNVDKISFLRCWKPIENAGCSYEHGNFGFELYSVDVPKSTDVHKVFALLEEGVRNKVWDFEEGHCGHSV